MTKYNNYLRGIERPSRYIGDEFGLSRSGGAFRIVMGFPDVYEVGMSHLGFRLLHASLCERKDLQVERVFLPWPDLQAKITKEGQPLLTLETFSPIKDFDLIGLSLQFELAIASVIKLFDLAHVPRLTKERADSGQRWPLIVVGGVGTLNPEPLAPFVDCFFIGEADQAIFEIVDCLSRLKERPRAEKIEQLSKIDGIYVPERVEVSYEGELGVYSRARGSYQLPIHRRYISDLDALPVPRMNLVPYCSVVHDRVAVEIQRGCSQGCRFCQAGFVTRPTRQRSPGAILEAARRQLGTTGYQDLSLLSLSAGDHPCLQEILAALIREHGPNKVSISLPSLRIETLHPEVADHIGKVRKRSFTLAPEAATDRLRRVINKCNSEEDLLESVRTVTRAGFSQIKLYFMIGLPTETEDDVLAIADLSSRVLAEATRLKKRVRLAVSVSTFIPKPHTPFQWEAAPSLSEIKRKQELLLSSFPRKIRLRWHDPGQSIVEAYLARGDRRMSGVLQRVVTEDYLGLDSWTEHFDLTSWQAAFEEAFDRGEIPHPEKWLGPRSPDDPLPWEHLDQGVSREYLLAQRSEAILERSREDCTDGICDACGVCSEEPLHKLAESDSSLLAQSKINARHNDDQRIRLMKVAWVRLHFHKRDRARLISHLEMVSAFERAARRAQLPLAFSGGYNPKPKMRFTPALPLGAESRCEFIEIGLSQPFSTNEIKNRIDEQLPPGLIIKRAELVTESLLKQIRGVHWRFLLPYRGKANECESMIDGGSETSWPESALQWARERLASGEIKLERKRGAPKDLKAMVLSLERGESASIEIKCRFDSEGTVRPAELLKQLFNLDQQELEATMVIRWRWLLSLDRGAMPPKNN